MDGPAFTPLPGRFAPTLRPSNVRRWERGPVFLSNRVYVRLPGISEAEPSCLRVEPAKLSVCRMITSGVGGAAYSRLTRTLRYALLP